MATLGGNPFTQPLCAGLLFCAASALVDLVSIGPHAPTDLLTSIVSNGATAFLIINDRDQRRFRHIASSNSLEPAPYGRSRTMPSRAHTNSAIRAKEYRRSEAGAP